MKTVCRCGGELEGPWVRFHWAPPYEEDNGHYVVAEKGAEPSRAILARPAPPKVETVLARGPGFVVATGHHSLETMQALLPERRPRQRMSSWLPEYFAAMGGIAGPHQVAPPPGAIPRKPWGKEDDLRLAVRQELERLGYEAHDLEQGHRPERGGARVSLGLPDVYFRGHGRRGWIETKRWDNEQTPEQVTWMLGELKEGGTYLLVYQVEQVTSWHTQHGEAP